MTLEEFFAVVGGNYRETIDRMMGEAMLRRFIMKFPTDPSFTNLEQALSEGCREEAFRAAHTIKGLCLNLGFGKLYQSSQELTEALRSDMPANAAELFAAVKADYTVTMDAIESL